MDLCLKNLFPANSFCYKPISGTRSCNSFYEITLFSKQHHRPFLLTASGKNKNHGNSSSSSSSSSGNGEPSIPGNNDGDKSNNNSHKRHQSNLDWRDFRAKLYRDELKEIDDTDTQKGVTIHNSKPLGTKWAHPIPGPETGCVLVATEKLDGVRTFERTVVLLLRSGTRQSQEGPFGIVINRPLHKKIKNIRPTNQDLTTSFSDCSLHFGGPLEASMFLLKSGEKLKVPGFEEVVPGLYFGARNSLDDASRLVKKGIIKPHDFSFFIGYAGWQIDQLRDEIESEYWYVAACSSSLLYEAMTDSSEGMWEKILQLMGGDYAELSQKPKHDP